MKRKLKETYTKIYKIDIKRETVFRSLYGVTAQNFMDKVPIMTWRDTIPSTTGEISQSIG